MSSSRTLSRKLRTSFTCIKPRFDPSIILLYIAASVEQYCDITQVNALPENEGILELHPRAVHRVDAHSDEWIFRIGDIGPGMPEVVAEGLGADMERYCWRII